MAARFATFGGGRAGQLQASLFRARQQRKGKVMLTVITAPAITGTTTSGSLLTCSTGTWRNSPSRFTFQWLADGTAISGATASTYTLQAGDVGKLISCRVTARNFLGKKTVTTAAVGPVT